MRPLHSLLRRQLKRVLPSVAEPPEEWAPLLAAVNDAYEQFDTDRRMLERSLDLSSQELLQANAELRSTFQAFPDLSIRVGIDGRIVDVRGRPSGGFDGPVDGLLGKRLRDVAAAPGRELQTALASAQEDGTIVSLEYEAVHHERGFSDVAFFEARLVPLPAGEALILVREITERRRAEERLRESERRNRLLFENALVGVFRTTGDGVVLDCNQAFARILGFASAAEVHEHNALSFYADPADRQVLVARLRQEGRVLDNEWRGRHQDGSDLWLLENVAYHAENGKEVIEGTVIDISARKQAELQREESLAFFHALIESMEAGVLVESANRVVVAANAALGRIFGIPGPAGGLVGTDCVEASRASASLLTDPLPFPARIVEIVDRLEAVSGEELAFADGRIFERDYLPIHSATGELFGHMWQYREVTERRSLELQLQQSQKMEAVGRLAGGVAHDFNNLLTMILGYAELIAREAAEPELAAQAREISKAGERAAGLTRQLLAFSRKQVLQTCALDLNTVVGGLHTMLQRLIGEDVRVALELEPHLRTVRADAGQLEQVIVNLAINARDAMTQGGELVIGTANVTAGELQLHDHVHLDAGQYVVLSVSDTGCGMDTETQNRAFEPFFTTKPAGKGTGLGLSTVYGIVRQSGGCTWVRSEPGKGTEVKVCLPAIEEAITTAAASEEEDRPKRGAGSILVVEDDAAIRRLARAVLSRAGYEVAAAGSAAEAVAAASEAGRAIDLLVSDVVLPDGDGPRVAESVRAMFPRAKVLFMSGYTDERVALREDPERGVHFLQKPFTPSSLVARIAGILRD